MQRRRFLSGAALALLLGACGRATPRGSIISPGATVLALGDSITFGTGAPPDASYPAELARLTGWNVVNAGVPGDTSAQALQRLPGLLDAHAPKLVVVSIGGNDFLRRLPEAETRANLRDICARILVSGSQCLLVAVPKVSLGAVAGLGLDDHDIYEAVSKEFEMPLHANGWSQVLSDPALRSDAIHANAEGYKRFAKGVAETAQTVGFLG